MRQTLAVLARPAALLVAIIVAIPCWRALDEAGWIRHSHDTPTYITGEWLVGEYRECAMATTTPAVEGARYSPEELAKLPALFSGPHAEQKIAHVLPVVYWGRIERPRKFLVHWRCQRLAESLKCWALN